MVGKWYKWLEDSGEYLTQGKWYEVQKVTNHNIVVMDNENNIENLNYIPLSQFGKCFDTSNPMDYNPDEVKEEKVKEPDLKIETITIVVINDEKYITNTVFDLKQLVKHLKEVTYRLDKQINEG